MPIISFVEPVLPRYVHVNSVTNRIHLMVPVVSGTEIGLDNTCKTVYALQEFFGKTQNSALRELEKYKNALEFDIGFILEQSEVKKLKLSRLSQIDQYIKLINQINETNEFRILKDLFPTYPAPIKTLMSEKNSNLSSMVLNPASQDAFLRTVNPVFSLNHNLFNARDGSLIQRTSPFQETLIDAYKKIPIKPKDTRSRLTAAVVASLEGESINFSEIQRILNLKTRELLGCNIDFHQFDATTNQERTRQISAIQAHEKNVEISFIMNVLDHATPKNLYIKYIDYAASNPNPKITKEFIDAIMRFDETASTEDYVEALFGYCALTLFDNLLESPFYTTSHVEGLSIATQFFLGTANIYCALNHISASDFGKVLDSSKELSDELATRVCSAILSQANVEDALLDYLDEHIEEFSLIKPFSAEDRLIIKKQCTERYAQIKDSSHFDEFLVFDVTKPGKFVQHQGCICTDFCEVSHQIEDSDFTQNMCEDFRSIQERNGNIIPPQNPCVAGEVEVDVETLLTQISDAQFEKLPNAIKDKCRSHPYFHTRHFLLSVARGTPDKTDKTLIKTEAEVLLTKTSTHTQILLQTPGIFTDYSGRTFNCTAYEYAYWAYDTHMCRMLESHMDVDTKALLLKRIEAIETTGLSYQQNGKQHRSVHFDLTTLLTALETYITGFDAWNDASALNTNDMEAAWMTVGKAQRDLPVHFAQEYCKPGRSFTPIPSFNVDREDIPKETLPRSLIFQNFEEASSNAWFPLTTSHSGLGFNFALIRSGSTELLGVESAWAGEWDGTRFVADLDLAAMTRLNEVRTIDTINSRKHLSQAPFQDSRQDTACASTGGLWGQIKRVHDESDTPKGKRRHTAASIIALTSHK